jgi:hypothetical protein
MRKPVSVIVGVFSNPDTVLYAAEEASTRGWKGLDMITPYPLHGSEKALRLKHSWVPWVTLIMGLGGGLGGLALQGWTSAIDWQINVGGKSYSLGQRSFRLRLKAAADWWNFDICAMLVASKLPKRTPVILDERPDMTNLDW